MDVILRADIDKVGLRGEGEAGGSGGGNQFVPAGATAGADADFGGGSSDDDIPF